MTPSLNVIPTAWRKKNGSAPPWGESAVEDAVTCAVDDSGDEEGSL